MNTIQLFATSVFLALSVHTQRVEAAPTTTTDEHLGRLFYTPQRRAILDQLRNRNARISSEQQSDQLRLDGIVLRSDGHSTIWINGKAHHDRPPVASFGSRSARFFSGDGKSTEVQVGETITLSPNLSSKMSNKSEQ